MTELLTIPGSWNLDFRHAAGAAASRFLVALRDEQKILGSPCPKCSRVRVPARSYCEDCFVTSEDDWVQVGPSGTVEASTQTCAAFPGYDPPPHTIAYVVLDGADTAMCNYVKLPSGETPNGPLEVGARVNARFASTRNGAITDFWWETTD